MSCIRTPEPKTARCTTLSPGGNLKSFRSSNQCVLAFWTVPRRGQQPGMLMLPKSMTPSGASHTQRPLWPPAATIFKNLSASSATTLPKSFLPKAMRSVTHCGWLRACAGAKPSSARAMAAFHNALSLAKNTGSHWQITFKTDALRDTGEPVKAVSKMQSTDWFSCGHKHRSSNIYIYI